MNGSASQDLMTFKLIPKSMADATAESDFRDGGQDSRYRARLQLSGHSCRYQCAWLDYSATRTLEGGRPFG